MFHCEVVDMDSCLLAWPLDGTSLVFYDIVLVAIFFLFYQITKLGIFVALLHGDMILVLNVCLMMNLKR